MRELPIQTFEAADGDELSYLDFGEGRPVVLLHGYLMTAYEAWVRTGIAARLAEAGLRAIMPDMRGHGGSAPDDPAAYSRDVLVDDGFALLDRLGLEDPDLVGYSMGSVMALRMLVRGARSGRAVIGGTGLEPIIHMAGRGNHHRAMLGEPGSVEAGSVAERTDAYLDRIGADRVALRRVLDTFVDTPVEALGEIEVPVLLLFGEEEDEARGSVDDLAAGAPAGDDPAGAGRPHHLPPLPRVRRRAGRLPGLGCRAWQARAPSRRTRSICTGISRSIGRRAAGRTWC